MILNKFPKLILPTILCLFMSASAMLSEQETQALETFGQQFLEHNKMERNAQLRGFVKRLPGFIQANLSEILQTLDANGQLSLENVINMCVKNLLTQLRLNEQDKARCRAFVAEDLEKCLQLQPEETGAEDKDVSISSTPFSIARLLMNVLMFCTMVMPVSAYVENTYCAGHRDDPGCKVMKGMYTPPPPATTKYSTEYQSSTRPTYTSPTYSSTPTAPKQFTDFYKKPEWSSFNQNRRCTDPYTGKKIC